MPEDRELNTQLPGAEHIPLGEGFTPGAASEDHAAEVARLTADLAQANAIIAELNAKVQGMATVTTSPVAAVGVPRIIGEDWSNRTVAEAVEAKVDRTVLCSDGYYVPSV